MPKKSTTFKIIDSKTAEILTSKFDLYIEKRQGAYLILQFDSRIKDPNEAFLGSSEGSDIPYIIKELKRLGVPQTSLMKLDKFLQ